MRTATRDQALAAARSALAAGREPTMQELAATAGVSLRTLYRLFGSRQALLREVDWKPAPTARERILDAALELVGRQGLAALSMDDLAAAAGVSRATLYRLFPGKPALFRDLLEAYSPWEVVADAIDAAADPAPERVVPEVGRALAGAIAGRAGLLLPIVLEMARGEPDTAEGVRYAMGRGLPDVLRYLEEQMEAGRLLRMHPVVAFQLLGGPIFTHLLTHPLAALMGFDQPMDEVVDEIVQAWLRAMRPSPVTRARAGAADGTPRARTSAPPG